jgi:hypothetical protein
MSKTRRGKKARRAIPSEPLVRKEVPPTPRERRGMMLWAIPPIAFGAMLLVKVVVTLLEGTAWDDLSTSSRQTQPVEYWSFVLTYLAMAGFCIWLGVELWPRRNPRAPRRPRPGRR